MPPKPNPRDQGDTLDRWVEFILLKTGLKARARIMMAIILTVGLLTTSTYPAVYAPYVAQTSVLAHSSPGTPGGSQTGSPLVTAGRVEFAFRLLNAISFASSILAFISATLTLISIANRASWEPITICSAFFFFALAVTAALGGALTGVLAFVSRSGGIAIVGITIVCIVICCAAALCFLYRFGEDNTRFLSKQEGSGPPDISVLVQAAPAAPAASAPSTP